MANSAPPRTRLCQYFWYEMLLRPAMTVVWTTSRVVHYESSFDIFGRQQKNLTHQIVLRLAARPRSPETVACSSPANSSFTGSHFNGRCGSSALCLQVWQMDAVRWARSISGTFSRVFYSEVAIDAAGAFGRWGISRLGATGVKSPMTSTLCRKAACRRRKKENKILVLLAVGR